MTPQEIPFIAVKSQEITSKTCPNCGEKLPATAEYFYKNRSRKDGWFRWCKVCANKQHKQYYQDNKEKIFKKNKQYIQINKEEILKKMKHYKQTKKEEILKQRKQYRQINKEDIAKKYNQYYQANKEAISKHKKQSAQEGLLISSSIAKKIQEYEQTRKSPQNGKYLEVKCAYCGRFTVPTNNQGKNRISAINGAIRGEARIYCNNQNDGNSGCRAACPTFNQTKYPKGFRQNTAREVLPELRHIVFEHDNYTCQRCNITIKDAQLHAHHIKGAVKEPMLANDITNVITLCKSCHKLVHKQDGCSYIDYRREQCTSQE